MTRLVLPRVPLARLARSVWAARHRLRAVLPATDRVYRIACGHCGQWTKPRHYNPRIGLCRPCGHQLAAAYRRHLFHRISLQPTRPPGRELVGSR